MNHSPLHHLQRLNYCPSQSQWLGQIKISSGYAKSLFQTFTDTNLHVETSLPLGLDELPLKSENSPE
jgi:hypothetical protein